jgi:hypothetical protein
MDDRDLLDEDIDLLGEEDKKAMRRQAPGFGEFLSGAITGDKEIRKAIRPEVEYPEVAKGAFLGGKRAVGAVGQLIPGVSEPSTKMAREAQKEIEQKPERQAGALLFDVLGLGKLTKPLQAATTAGRVAKTAGAAAGATALTTPSLEEDEGMLQQRLKAGAIGFGAGATGQVFKETAARLVPGAINVANDPTRKLLEEAEKRGITVPISDMTENAFLRALDRVFENPLMVRNAPIVNRELNRAMGQAGDVIDLGKSGASLSQEVQQLVGGKQVRLGSISQGAQQALNETFSAIPALESKPLQKVIASARDMSLANLPITGQEWHLARQQLNRQYVAALNSGDYQRSGALRTLINEWDDAAYNSIKDPTFKNNFINWKAKYTAFSDVSEAANRNEKSRQLILRGTVDPTDLMNVIAAKRPTEFLQRAFTAPAAPGATAAGGRPQTTLGAVGGGLDIYGREATSVAPYIRATSGLVGLAGIPFTGGTSAAIPTGLIAGKGLQSYLYSPSGQRAMLRGISPQPTPTSFAAPVAATRQFLPQSPEER